MEFQMVYSRAKSWLEGIVPKEIKNLTMLNELVLEVDNFEGTYKSDFFLVKVTLFVRLITVGLAPFRCCFNGDLQT